MLHGRAFLPLMLHGRGLSATENVGSVLCSALHRLTLDIPGVKRLYLQLRKNGVRLPVELLPRKQTLVTLALQEIARGARRGASQASSCQEVISMLSGMV